MVTDRHVPCLLAVQEWWQGQPSQAPEVLGCRYIDQHRAAEDVGQGCIVVLEVQDHTVAHDSTR